MNAFYDEKLEEQEKRLSVLTESVVSSLKEKYQESSEREVSEEKTKEDPKSARMQHRSLPSLDWRDLMKRITRKASSMEERASSESPKQTVLDVDELDADDPDALVRDKSEVKQIAVADSIQRALVDQYRTSKLLQNYAILNYTGFVKIVKKHNKSLPNRKGKFKSLTQASNICDEGRAIEKLAERLELRYANWFCDGNHREAHAQLLPKRGGRCSIGYVQSKTNLPGVWI